MPPPPNNRLIGWNVNWDSLFIQLVNQDLVRFVCCRDGDAALLQPVNRDLFVLVLSSFTCGTKRWLPTHLFSFKKRNMASFRVPSPKNSAAHLFQKRKVFVSESSELQRLPLDAKSATLHVYYLPYHRHTSMYIYLFFLYPHLAIYTFFYSFHRCSCVITSPHMIKKRAKKENFAVSIVKQWQHIVKRLQYLHKHTQTHTFSPKRTQTHPTHIERYIECSERHFHHTNVLSHSDFRTRQHFPHNEQQSIFTAPSGSSI